MKQDNLLAFENQTTFYDQLTQLLQTGARKLISDAVEAELQVLLNEHRSVRTAENHAALVRNGYHPQRQIQTGIGPVSVRIPKVRSRTGEAVTFQSALVPPYVRKTRSLEAAIPWLYLKGVSTGEMSDALQVLVGPQAQGLSASTVSRLKQVWAEEYRQWRNRSLAEDRWVYIWADGVYSGLRSEDTKLCSLVVIGVTECGDKHFLAIEDGVRESTQSWREVLRHLQSRGMNIPKLAIGDGAMGFWAAMDEIYPDTRHQRCWVHKTRNVLNCLPKSVQDKAKLDLKEIWNAETKKEAEASFDRFLLTYDDKYPKATRCLTKDREVLLTFYDFPAKHWQSIRTSNPIESCFSTIRHRTKRSKGCLNRDGMLHMMFKLSQCAETNWRKLRGFQDLNKVVRGIVFKDGIQIEQEAA